MSAVTILNERVLRRLVPLDLEAVACIEDAFRALATKPVVMPPVMRLEIAEHKGEVDVKTAYVPGLDGFAIKVSPGFFDNPKLGLPSLNGLMVYFSARTGLVKALLLDNGYLTDLRTAAAGAVAARHLARADAQVAAVLGGGAQARLQLQALALVRPIRAARLWARRPEQAQASAKLLSDALAIPVEAVDDAATAIAGADIVVTTTPATSPILKADWIEPGQHVTAVGADAEHKNEIDPALIARADLYVPDSLTQARQLGELRHAIRAGLVSPDASYPELGAIVAGQALGRRTPEDVTICDLTGTGVQDTAIARLAVGRAEAAGEGAVVES